MDANASSDVVPGGKNLDVDKSAACSTIRKTAEAMGGATPKLSSMPAPFRYDG